MTTVIRRANHCHPAFALTPRWDSAFAEFMSPFRDAALTGRSIALDISEDADNYRVSAALAGARKEDINISIDGSDVSIAVDVKPAPLGEGERVHVAERFVGKTERRFRLASEIDEARVEAGYADGVLRLTLPKKPAASARKINIA